MNKKQNRLIMILVGIGTLLFIGLVALIFLGGDKSPVVSSSQEYSFKINDVSTSIEGGENNINLYLNGEGGSSTQTLYLQIQNDNYQPAFFKIYCDSNFNQNNGRCIPTQENSVNFLLNDHSSNTKEISLASFTDPLTKEGSYSGKIYVELVKYFDTSKNDYISSNSIINTYSITINVLDDRK